MQIAFLIAIANLSPHALALIDDCWSASGLGVAPYDTNDMPGDTAHVGFLEPGPDVKCVYTDANQVRWNKAKLYVRKAIRQMIKLLTIDMRSPVQDVRPTRTVANIVRKQER